jgi:hypothetical protein
VTPLQLRVAEPEAGRAASVIEAACLAIRFSVGCASIIHLIIQTILLDPSGAVWTDEAPNVSRLNPSGAVQIDAENPSRNRKVELESLLVGGPVQLPTSLRWR